MVMSTHITSRDDSHQNLSTLSIETLLALLSRVRHLDETISCLRISYENVELVRVSRLVIVAHATSSLAPIPNYSASSRYLVDSNEEPMITHRKQDCHAARTKFQPCAFEGAH
jgi:hypothetical protein